MAITTLTKVIEIEYDLNEHFLGDLVTNFVLGNYWNGYYERAKKFGFGDIPLQEEFKALEEFIRRVRLFSPLADAVLLLPDDVIGIVLPLSLVYSGKQRALYIGYNSLTVRGTKVTITHYK